MSQNDDGPLYATLGAPDGQAAEAAAPLRPKRRFEALRAGFSSLRKSASKLFGRSNSAPITTENSPPGSFKRNSMRDRLPTLPSASQQGPHKTPPLDKRVSVRHTPLPAPPAPSRTSSLPDMRDRTDTNGYQVPSEAMRGRAYSVGDRTYAQIDDNLRPRTDTTGADGYAIAHPVQNTYELPSSDPNRERLPTSAYGQLPTPAAAAGKPSTPPPGVYEYQGVAESHYGQKPKAVAHTSSTTTSPAAPPRLASQALENKYGSKPKAVADTPTPESATPAYEIAVPVDEKTYSSAPTILSYKETHEYEEVMIRNVPAMRAGLSNRRSVIGNETDPSKANSQQLTASTRSQPGSVRKPTPSTAITQR